MPTNSLDCSFNLMEIGQLDIQTNVGHVNLFHITRYLHQTALFPQNYSRCSGGVKKSAFNSLIELKYLDRISSGKQLNNSETCFPKRSNILISNFMSRDIF